MHIVWSTFFIQLIAFLILFFLLQRYAFGPLLNIMEQRKKLIAEQIGNAEASRLQAEQNMEAQKQALQQARKEAQDIIEQARVTSSKQAEEIVQTAKSESNRLKDDAVRDIENEKNKAISALRSQVGSLSVQIASKIIEKQVDEKAQEQLVDQYLSQVGKQS